MSPAFSSWSDFFAMGGYAFFVWLAVAMTVAPLIMLSPLVALLLGMDVYGWKI
ncbi:heme exporter protein CcmD, partial [Salmonella enterica]|uniref:heme exporter protein CcmD n=1 Tax=Salmonella enterica TaxID=28901 RepID=UPI0021B450B3